MQSSLSLSLSLSLTYGGEEFTVANNYDDDLEIHDMASVPTVIVDRY